MKNPIVLAAIATLVTVITYRLAGTISNRVLRGLGQLASVLGVLALMGLMSRDPEAASQAGQYYGGAIIIIAILGKLLGSSGKST